MTSRALLAFLVCFTLLLPHRAQAQSAPRLQLTIVSNQLQFDITCDRDVPLITQYSHDMVTWERDGRANIVGGRTTFLSGKPPGNRFYRVVVPKNELIILTQPQSVTVEESGSATLAVLAQDTGAMLYTWFRNGIEVAEGPDPTYRIQNASTSNAGAYRVRIAGEFYKIMSDEARVTVTPKVPPVSAPTNLRGRTITVGITSATGVFAKSGTYRFVAASTGSSYVIIPSGFVGSSSGSYSYARVGDLSARLVIIDSLVGSATADISFITPTAGTINMVSSEGLGSQRGNFIIE